MDKQRITHALHRIHQATARLEESALRLQADQTLARSTPHNDGMADKYEALRSDVAATLNDLDTLIESLEK